MLNVQELGSILQKIYTHGESEGIPGGGARDPFHLCAPHENGAALLFGSLTFLKGSFALGRSGQKMVWESSAGTR